MPRKPAASESRHNRATTMRNSKKSKGDDAHRLVQIVQGSSIPTFVINTRHRLTHWNKACENLTGISAEEILGTDQQWKAFYASQRPVMADLIVKNTLEKEISGLYRNKLQKSVIIEGAYEAEDFFPELGESGKWLFFTAAPLKDAKGTISGALETLQDITSRKNAERALRESEHRYRILTDHMADGVMLIQNEKLVFANHAFSQMLGIASPEKKVGLPAAVLFEGKLKQQLQESFAGLKHPEASEKKVFQGSLETREGNQLWIEIHLNPILLHGKPAALATLRDITETVAQRMAIEEEAAHLRQENYQLRATVRDRYRFGDIIGKSAVMQDVYEHILKAAATDANVIISGESGTGKELVAQAIHHMSDRTDKAFVPVNCGAIPENLVESEFFGYKKGAFTGAAKNTTGYLDAADQGTLFLDEVGEISLNMQIKLLRAAGEGGFTPLGSNKVRQVDIRIIAATNKNISQLVNKGLMREDFYYRISIIPIKLPPLRERKEDLPLLIDHYWREYSNDKMFVPLPGNVIEALLNHGWPGNIRELQNVLHRYRTLNRIDFMEEQPRHTYEREETSAFKLIPETLNLRAAVNELEKKLINRALHLNQWHRGKVAAQLGIDSKTLLKKMKAFGFTKIAKKR